MGTEYTNSRELPAPIASAIEKHDFVAVNNGISASRLSDAPQIAALKQMHKVQEDIADKTWALIHRGMLHVLEQGNNTSNVYRAAQAVYRAMKEQALVLKASDKNEDHVEMEQLNALKDQVANFARRYYPLEQERWMIRQVLSVDVPYTVDKPTQGGTVPMQLNKTVFDTIAMYDKQEQILYMPKICTVATAYKPHVRTPWEREANVQVYLLHYNGHPVKAVRAIMIFKDYNREQSKKIANYPSAPSQTIPLNFDSLEKIDIFVRGRLAKHHYAEEYDMPECNAADRWATADSYAVVRPGSDRYVQKKDLPTAQAAQDWINENIRLASGCVVDVVPGESRRCKDFCPVRHVCPQWQREQDKMRGLENKNAKEKFNS